MAKFDMGAAWEDSVVLLRSHSTLTGTIAAVFLFLPTLAVSWFGPTPVEPPAGASVDQVLAIFRESAMQFLPYQLLVSVIAAIGGVGILRLWLSRTGTSVGDALVFALKMIPTMIAVQLIMAAALVLIALLLIMPGVAAGGGAIAVLLLIVGMGLLIGLAAYFWGRLAAVSPVIADRTLYNPIAAIQESWALTRGNGWRIFLFLLLVMIVILVAALLLGLVAAAASGLGEAVGRLLSGFVEAGVAAVGGVVSAAISAAIYRQLTLGHAEEIFR